MKTALQGRGGLFTAAAVLLVGGVAWVFPRAAMATAGEWFLPALALTALVLANVMAPPWVLLRALLLVFGVVLVVSWNRASPSSTSHFAGAAFGCLVMVSVASWARTPRRLRAALLAFLCGGAAILLVGVAGTEIAPAAREVLRSRLALFPPSMRFGLDGLGAEGNVNPNAVASSVLLVLPMGMAVWTLGRSRHRDWRVLLPAGMVFVVGTATLAMTLSRTALIAVWLMTLGLLVRGMRSPLYRVIAAAIIVVPVLFMAGRLAFVPRVDEAMWDARSSWLSARSRAQILGQAFDTWKQSPWLGVGLNEFRRVYAPRPGDIPQPKDIAHAHNIFLQTALDVGLVGSVAYWGILVSLWWRAGQAAKGTSRTARAVAVGGAFSLIGVTLFGLTDAVPIGAKIGTLQWFAGGLILAAWQNRFAPSDTADAIEPVPAAAALST